MKLTKNQHVKCMFNNNIVIEGIVEEFVNDELTLISMNKTNICIIPNVKTSILCIKIFLEEGNSILVKQKLENDFVETSAKSLDDELQLKKLAELKKLLIIQEKKIIQEKLTSHQIGNERNPVVYEQQLRVLKK